MDKVQVLCDHDRELLQNFSRRSLERMQTSSLFAAVLGFFASYLGGNVGKEVEKDCLIIHESAAAFAAGRPACDLDLEEMFEKTKKVDRVFLDKLAVPSFVITVRYSDFADIRIRRIWRIARSVYDILFVWPDTASFPDAVRNAYTGEEFRKILTEILHLYNLETKSLGNSIRSPFHASVEAYSSALFAAMESATGELAEACTRKLFRDRTVHA